MRTTLGALLLAVPGLVGAGELELAVFLGPALPTYEQSFRYDPGPIPLPGVSIRQEGVFGLDAQGGLSFGGGLTYYLVDAFGIEARVDSAGVDVVTQEPSFTVEVRPPAPLPPINVRLEPMGTATVDRLTPVSLNLRLRTPGRVRFVFSAGMSWLPSVSFSVTETIALGVTGIGGGGLTIPTLPLQAGGRIEDAFGVNGGAGFRVKVADRIALFAEGRFFYFPERSLIWTRADGSPLSPAESALVEEITRRLGPVEFRPAFFQATAGIAVRF